ncbi:MAG TPA: DeoR/GlpR family DNA-binding transcription regulator [Spirochaetales bacterium]|nr:DeoR/GlpR family DNA-binding transcription regulator [Spirochaetales bacterium]
MSTQDEQGARGSQDAKGPQKKRRGRGKVGNTDILDAVWESIAKSGSRKVTELAQEFNVSQVSIRKCLNELERRGLVQRLHGEARIYKGDDIPFRMHVRYAEKQAIAKKAASLVNPGDTIFIEAGSAIAMFAELIKNVERLTVITPNVYVARLFRGTRTKVILLGGIYQAESESLVGPAVCEAIQSLGFSKAFLGISGFTMLDGFLLNDLARAEVSKCILARAAECEAHVWILTDSSKFGSPQIAKITSDYSLVTGIITDNGIPAAYRAHLESNGVKVLTC